MTRYPSKTILSTLSVFMVLLFGIDSSAIRGDENDAKAKRAVLPPKAPPAPKAGVTAKKPAAKKAVDPKAKKPATKKIVDPKAKKPAANKAVDPKAKKPATKAPGADKKVRKAAAPKKNLGFIQFTLGQFLRMAEETMKHPKVTLQQKAGARTLVQNVPLYARQNPKTLKKKIPLSYDFKTAVFTANGYKTTLMGQDKKVTEGIIRKVVNK